MVTGKLLAQLGVALLLLSSSLHAVFDEDGWPVQQQEPALLTEKVSPAQYAQFKRGNTIFDCEGSCAFVYDGAVLKFLYESGDWEALARKTLEYGLLEDESYFFLAKAAEGLRLFKAAEKYYRRSIAATNADISCGGFLPTCEGFEFPGDAQLALADLQQIKKGRQHASNFPLSQKEVRKGETGESVIRQVALPEGRVNRNAIAVVIGNRNYSVRNKDLSDVDYAHRDHDEMVNFLVNGLGYRQGNVISLKDATQADLNRVFGIRGNHQGELYNWVKEGESDLFVFYSGHGVPDLETKEAYLMPVDADPDLIRMSGYPLELLYQNLSKIQARSMTVVVDACFSGRSHAKALIKNISALVIRTRDPAHMLKRDNVTVITASRATEVASWDENRKLGLLTHYFLEGVGGAADREGDNDQVVTLGELKEYLEGEVTYQARRQYNRKQNPQVLGDSGAVMSRSAQWDFLMVPLKQPTAVALAAGSREAQREDSGVLQPEMVLVEGGCFQMGSPVNESGRFYDEQLHRVCVDDFKVGVFEVTNKEYRQYRPTHAAGKDDDYPVVNVSWHDVNDYIGWLNDKTGKNYRLPTEAEWEYAARSGTATSRYWGDDPQHACKFGNVADQSVDGAAGGLRLHECFDGADGVKQVGKYRPNHLWIHDMLGNAWEWTCSQYVEQYDGREDRCADVSAMHGIRVLRGGSWLSEPRNVRSANRHFMGIERRYEFFGFRLVEDG